MFNLKIFTKIVKIIIKSQCNKAVIDKCSIKIKSNSTVFVCFLCEVVMEIEIFEHEFGFGYRVGNVYQEFDPEYGGFVSMTRERAEEMAAIVAERLA